MWCFYAVMMKTLILYWQIKDHAKSFQSSGLFLCLPVNMFSLFSTWQGCKVQTRSERYDQNHISNRVCLIVYYRKGTVDFNQYLLYRFIIYVFMIPLDNPVNKAHFISLFTRNLDTNQKDNSQQIISHVTLEFKDRIHTVLSHDTYSPGTDSAFS